MYNGASTHGARPHGSFDGRSLPDAHAAHTALTVTFVPLRFISTSVHPPSTSI